MKHIISAILLLHIAIFVFADPIGSKKDKTDANIVGHVMANGKHIPFASVFIKGTTIGLSTDDSGHFQLINLPEGTHVVKVQVLGYKSAEKTVLSQ